jgi:hypothetical protein
MFCYNCHKEIQEDAVFCPFCGAQVGVAINSDIDETNKPETGSAPVEEPFSNDTATVIEPVAEPIAEPETEQESSSEQPEAEEGEDSREVAPHTISGFVWSLVANECAVIPVLGFVFALIALVKSSKGRNIVKANPEHYKLKGMLTAAFIISIIALVGSIIEPIAFISLFTDLKDTFNELKPFSSSSFV